MPTQPHSFARRVSLATALAASLFACSVHADQQVPGSWHPRMPLPNAELSQCVDALHGQWFQRTELFFGRNSPAGVISEADFQHFVDTVVTPLFPDGLTVIDAKGQFRASAESPVEREDSKLLILLYVFDKRLSDAVEEIRSRYKERFQQQSVLRVDRATCVSF